MFCNRGNFALYVLVPRLFHDEGFLSIQRIRTFSFVFVLDLGQKSRLPAPSTGSHGFL